MLKKAAYMTMIAVILAAQPARAEDAVSIRVAGPQQGCVSGDRQEICHHFFESDTFTISAAPRSGAESKDCPQLRAELVQMSSRLEAPVAGAVTPEKTGICQATDFKIQLPAVSHETEFEVLFTQENGTGMAKTLAAVPLKAYPRNLLDAVQSWAKFEENALIVKDAEGKLADFLDRHKVQYQLQSAAARSARKLFIVVGDPTDEKAEKPEGDVLYINEKMDDLPVVTVNRTAQRATVTAEMKLLDGLAADDPLAQKRFIKIFNLIAK